MDRTILIEVNGSYIRKDSNVAGVTGEGNSRFMNIIFDESWLEYAKTVTFWDAKGENPVKRILTTDYLTDPTVVLDYTIPIPAEALTCQGKMTFVIDGSIEGARKRSISDTLKVEFAPQADDANDPVDPTPSQFEQIQAQVDKILPDMIEERLQAQEARNEAVNAAEEATASAESASEANESAGVAMAAAVEAANVARDAEAGATEAKEAAEKIKEEITDFAGGDFPTREEAQGYASQAEANAKAYTDEQLTHIPTPDVSGQISEHNADDNAHPSIRTALGDALGEAKSYTDQKLAAIPTPDVSGQIETHNSDETAHPHIRTLVQEVSAKVDSKAPMYTYGTTDLTAGVTPLETGKLHFVYE